MKKTAEKMKKNHEMVLLALFDLTSGSRVLGLSAEDLAAEAELSEDEVSKCRRDLQGLVTAASKGLILTKEGLEQAQIFDERRYRAHEGRRNFRRTLIAVFIGALIGVIGSVAVVIAQHYWPNSP